MNDGKDFWLAFLACLAVLMILMIITYASAANTSSTTTAPQPPIPKAGPLAQPRSPEQVSLSAEQRGVVIPPDNAQRAPPCSARASPRPAKSPRPKASSINPIFQIIRSLGSMKFRCRRTCTSSTATRRRPELANRDATFVAAFCNAIYAATGKRIRELPTKNTPLT